MTRMLVVASPTLSPLSIGGPIPIDGQPRWWRCECGHRTRFGAGYSNPRHHHSGDAGLGSMVSDGPFPFTVAVWQEINPVRLRMAQHQADRRVHPYTCANRGVGNHRTTRDTGVLVPGDDGWFCPDCDYTQSYHGPSVTERVGAVVATVEVTGPSHHADVCDCPCVCGVDGCLEHGTPVDGWHTPTGTVTRLDVPIPMDRPTGVCVMCDAEDGPPSHVRGHHKCCPDCEHSPASHWWAAIDMEVPA